MIEPPGGDRVRPRAAVLWEDSRGGMERCRLEEASGAPRLNGVILTAFDGVPAEVRYVVTADSAWRTTACHVVIIDPVATRRLHLHARGGAWFDDSDSEVEALRGAVDVDLGCTPATNTLPVRRLGLATGESAEITAAWVRFPELSVEPSAQRYTRLGEGTSRYESATYTAEIEVDEAGLVTRYADVWRARARWP